MTYFLLCNASGEITSMRSCPDDEFALQADAYPGKVLIVTERHVDAATEYVSDVVLGIISAKPPLGAVADKLSALADNTDTVTISGLPDPTRAVISGPASSAATIADGVLSLTFDYPGAYTVRLVALNKLEQEISIVAT